MKTVDGYYESEVKFIIDSSLKALVENPKRKFIYVEQYVTQTLPSPACLFLLFSAIIVLLVLHVLHLVLFSVVFFVVTNGRAFFTRWWYDPNTSDQQREQMKKVVSEGRWEFVLGRS